MLPNAQDLKNFIEVVSVKNITRASQRLGITQPSLSQSIQKLERTVGAQLLIRGKSGVALTRAGKAVFSKSQELLNVWDQIRADAHQQENEIRGQFTIGCHPSVAQYTLPFFLPRILAKEKLLEFRLSHDISRKIVERLLIREIDLGITVNPIQHPDLIIIPLMTDHFSLWHSPTKRTSNVLFCDTALTQVNWMIEKLSKNGFKPSQVIQSDNLEVIRTLVSAGAGYGLLPTRVARADEENGLLKVNKNYPEYKDKICLVYRMDSMKSAASKFLISEIKECDFE